VTSLRTTEAESMTQVLSSLRQSRRHASITALKRHFIQNSFHFTRIVPRVSAENGHPDLGSSGEPLQVLRVRGDGNCLFRSLAQSYTALTCGTLLNQVAETDMARALRQQICDALVIQRDSVEPFLVDCDFDTYVSMMRRDGCWGGEPELSVAPIVLQRSIEVYVVHMHPQW
jgi:hypothetical protein